jgi:prevent-host-death family protein
MPQLVPVSELRYNHREVFERLKSGAILLAQRSKPAAVLVSVEEWDRRARRLIELEGLLEAKQALARVDAGLATTTTLEELKQQLAQLESKHETSLGN